MTQYSLLVLLIGLLYLYFKLKSYSPKLIHAFEKRKDARGKGIALFAQGVTLVSLPLIGLATLVFALTFRAFDMATIYTNFIATIVVVLGYSLLPHLYLKLISAVKNNHSSIYAFISIIQILIFIAAANWFSSNFNKGPLTFHAIQFAAIYMFFDALYELWFLFTRKTKKFTIIGIVVCCLYIASLVILPLDRLFVFNWSTLQDTPLNLGLYFLISKALLNLLLTPGVRQSARAR